MVTFLNVIVEKYIFMFYLLLSVSTQEFGVLLFVQYEYSNLVFCFLSNICNHCLTGGMKKYIRFAILLFVVNFALIFDNFALTFFSQKNNLSSLISLIAKIKEHASLRYVGGFRGHLFLLNSI